jgi:hypothetical protein
VKLTDRIATWTHWRRAHRGPGSTERHEDYADYVNALSGKPSSREVSYSDIQCQTCNEIGGRLRVPKTM